jgi:hypothetical protein
METMTIHKRLLELGANAREARQAETLLARFLPVGRPVEITDEILKAARSGYPALVADLLAEEVEPEDDEIALMAAIDEENDGTLYDLDDCMPGRSKPPRSSAKRAS